MQDLANKEKKQIGKNLKLIRKKLNITIEELANTLVLSTGTIKDIEAGKAASMDNIINVVYFLGLTLKEAADTNYQIPLEPELRNRIVLFHKKHKIVDTYNLLDKQPAIKIIITDRFIPNGYLDKAVYVKDLISFYHNDYGISLSPSSLSNELKNLVEKNTLIITNPDEKYHKYKKK
ncbi:hypothetical protein A9P82_08810 [Arachidicoccus ginsenosidimutans]|uniref:helix-turn-helix domain-containing protein n=1 Tax=Arachidicoccus sp. BS20 TaxID=1850526 RepID=UPI0007F156E2|nr:helix-turn-helix transcriptional regulator [Arachidicoccus sp. BS20]ANI89383.1 hypothetical protein A9P82_08810 [Arachidicoccus sp. BS20]